MIEPDKNPTEMRTDEIREEIEACYESLNTLSSLLGMKAKIGGDVGGGILRRAEVLQEELKVRNEHQ